MENKEIQKRTLFRRAGLLCHGCAVYLGSRQVKAKTEGGGEGEGGEANCFCGGNLISTLSVVSSELTWIKIDVERKLHQP